MAYFDSPKNRAIWERELRGLRAEKERRAREGYTPNEARSKAAQVKKEENHFRRRTNLKELERQEQEAREARRAARPARQRGMERQKEPGLRRQEPVMRTGGRTL